MSRTTLSPTPMGPCSFSLGAVIVTKRVAKRNGNEAMKCKDHFSEREYQDRLESLLKNVLNTNLQPLRSLETATKKRRAQKKATASGFAKSTKATSGNGRPRDQ